jgi:hypothetical protein
VTKVGNQLTLAEADGQGEATLHQVRTYVASGLELQATLSDVCGRATSPATA